MYANVSINITDTLTLNKARVGVGKCQKRQENLNAL